MIEVPRAAIRSAHIAKYADFFSFGTNDLTQMTFAFSRDDVATFLPSYLEKNVLDVDPFKSIDEEGVGFLIANATQQGRAVNPNLSVGICGEHGGDPLTIDFCYRAGLTYVSCSPFRVPVARLSAAQAVLNNLPERKSASKAPAEKKAADKKKAVKKPAAKKPAAKKVADKKAPAKKKPAAKKTTVKKAAVKRVVNPKKPVAKTKSKRASATKVPVKKPAAKKPAAKKAADKKPVAKKAPAKKPLVKKASTKKTMKKPVVKKPKK
jgi:pyruvate,orthophosphate dikinase